MKSIFKGFCILLAFCWGGTWFVLSPAHAAHRGTVTFEVSLLGGEKAGRAEAWLPYPLSDAFQTISEMTLKSDADGMGVEKDPRSGALYLRASWKKPSKAPALTMRFEVDSHYAKFDSLNETQDPFPVEVLPFLKASQSVPSEDPLFVEVGTKMKEEPSILKRAYSVYTWVVENTFRDEGVKEGCGLGLPIRTLQDLKGGGKCADISAVFVTLARAAGIPARDVYGLRIATPKSGEITGNYHCWAEFYLPGTGWVPADPADVRKAMLADKVELKDAGKLKAFFWAGDDLFRIALNRDTRETVLSETTRETPLTYFMYPYAEIDGKSKNGFSPKDFTYKVTLELK